MLAIADDSGTCGNGVTYFFEEATGILTISKTGEGNGEMTSHPWSTYKNSITKVVIEVGVTSIGSSAFYGCSGLTNVTTPNSVTSIGSSAFYGCSGLTSVTIPNSVTSIGGYAFQRCSGLTSVTIPNSATSIGESPFASCSGLTYISVASGNTKYDSRNNCNAIIVRARFEICPLC